MPLTLCDYGCVATTAELRRHLQQDSVVDIFQASRGVVRIRRGLYACAHLSGEQLTALRCGGVLDCISALEEEEAVASVCGIELAALHVRFRRGDRWARSRIEAAPAPVVAHWHAWRMPRRDALTNRSERTHRRPVVPLAHVAPDEAFAQSLECLTPDESARVIALLTERRVLATDQIAQIVAAAPRRIRQALRRLGVGAAAG